MNMKITKMVIITSLLFLVVIISYAGVKYQVNNGLVKDLSTGLIWTKCSLVASNQVDQTINCTDVHVNYEWADAVSACENLDYEGIVDWRLPNIRELQSIVTYKYETVPTINASIFPNTELNSHYWSSTIYVEKGVPNSGAAYTVHFEWGNVAIQFTSDYTTYPDHTSYVRCVTGP